MKAINNDSNLVSICDKTESDDHGDCLDILINDEDWRVRAEVAKQGYGLRYNS